MKLSDLILAIGDDNVEFQNLDASMTGIQTNKQGVSRITFQTNAINATQVATDSDKVGLVVWLPREKVREITKGLKE